MDDSRKTLRRLALALGKSLSRDVDISEIALGAAYEASIGLLAADLGIERRSADACLAGLFPSAVRAHGALHRSLTSAQALAALNAWLVATPGQPVESVAWLYQYLKEPWEQAAVAASLADGVKIAGRQLRWATQFFTEPYMVRFLVQATLESVDPATVRVLDPACGGGNFLAEALSVLFERLEPVVASPDERIHRLFTRQIVGYDLDARLAEIARLVLFLAGARLLGRPPEVAPAAIFGGKDGDEVGFLDAARVPMVEQALAAEGPRVVVTNPPFCGRRLVSDSLRHWIRAQMPEAGADLCAAFVLRCAGLLRPGDRCGLVHQTSWMYLSTFERMRRTLHEHVVIHTCAELGSDAFMDLRGEKTRVALTVLTTRPGAGTSRFLDLVGLPPREKEAVLQEERAAGGRLHLCPSAEVLEGGRPVRYAKDPVLEARAARLPRYGEFADPMQGTSTGDNARFVRYSWECDPEDPDWRPVSKGGGYCKWTGLNRYRVRWGEDGAHIRANPGSALRNLDRMARTHLVYSDTGTLGMNVRVFEPGKVFIASGPGIEVRTGRHLAHLAYLNSRVATYFMRQLSPKLTVSPGYLRQLPFSAELAEDEALETIAARCVALKREAVSRKLGNDEYRFEASHRPLEEVLEDLVLGDLAREAERLELEAETERRIVSLLGISKDELRTIEGVVGSCAGALKGRRLSLDREALDRALAERLDLACQYAGSRGHKTPIGCEGALEALALREGVSPRRVLEAAREAGSGLVLTRRRYMEDLLHRAVLHELGFVADGPWAPRAMSQGAVLAALGDRIDPGEAARVLGDDIGSWLTRRLPLMHAAVFLQRPILHVGGGVVRLERVS